MSESIKKVALYCFIAVLSFLSANISTVNLFKESFSELENITSNRPKNVFEKEVLINENCESDKMQNIASGIKYCLHDKKLEIESNILSLKKEISSKLENSKIDNSNLLNSENLSLELENLYTNWLEYRDSFCYLKNEINTNSMGYNSFIESCEYDLSIEFMKFLEELKLDLLI